MVMVCISQEKLQNEIQFSARRVVANHFDFTNPTVNERGLKEKLQNFYCWEKVQNQGGQWVFTKYRPQNTQISTKYDKISIAKARIYKMTHFATKVRIFIMAGLLLLYILFSWRCMSNKIYIFGKKEASRVICGINEDHFN